MPREQPPMSRIANPYITGRLDTVGDKDPDATRRIPIYARPMPRLGPAIARLLSLLALMAICAGLFASLAFVDRLVNRGVVRGPDLTPIPYTGQNPVGANVFLEKEADRANVDRSLEALAAGHFKWIRQSFAWNDIEIGGKGDFEDRRNPANVISAWDKYDYIVDKAASLGINIMARVDSAPDWSRPPGVNLGVHGPPANYQDYADFVAALVSRYKGKITYFQLWNEPNLAGEWDGFANPAAYVDLLKGAYSAAKRANPDAVIVMAALAQTNEYLDVPNSAGNDNELDFLQKMYDAGAKDSFDVASVMVYGLGYPPDYRSTDLRIPGDNQRINFSRALLFREVMEKNGDTAKPVWASEYAWLSLPPDWGNYDLKFGESVDEQTQAKYLVEGYDRAQTEWPWMGPMFVWHLRDPDPEPTGPAQRQPARWFAIMNADFSPRPAFTALSAYAARFPESYTGAYTSTSPAVGQDGDKTTIRFHGTRLDLVLDATMGLDSLGNGSIDGLVPAGWLGNRSLPLPSTFDDSRWASVANWPAPSGAVARKVTVAQGLDDTDHTFAFTAQTRNGADPRALLGYVVSREDPAPWRVPLGYGMLVLVFTWTTLRFTVGLVRLPATIRAGLRRPGLSGERAAALLAGVGLSLTLAVYYFAPPEPLAWVSLLAWFALAAWRPGTALTVTAAVIPFYWVPRYLSIPFPLAGGHTMTATLPLSETCLWLTLAAWGAHKLLRPFLARPVGVEPANRVTTYLRVFNQMQGPVPLRDRMAAWFGRRRRPQAVPASANDVTGYLDLYQELQGPAPLRARIEAWLQRDLFGLPGLALLAVGTFSLLTVANPDALKDSLRAYRWVIVEPLLFYYLATEIMRGRRLALRLLDGFAAGVALAAIIALVGGIANMNILNVEQVTRLQGTFPHPNNLGIVMGRGVTLVGVCGLFLTAPGEKLRRRLYLLAAGVMLVALLLSFSRGAYLAVAVALVAAVLVANRRWGLFLLAGGLVAVGLSVLVAALGLLPERLVSEGSGFIRLDLWQASLAMLRDHPIFGVGLDQFYNQYRDIYVQVGHQLERWLSHPHNLLLDCWLSLGIIGMLVGGWIVFRYFRASLALSKRSDPVVRAVALGALAMLVDFLVHGAVDNSYFLQDLALIFWLACSLLQLLRRS